MSDRVNTFLMLTLRRAMLHAGVVLPLAGAYRYGCFWVSAPFGRCLQIWGSRASAPFGWCLEICVFSATAAVPCLPVCCQVPRHDGDGF